MAAMWHVVTKRFSRTGGLVLLLWLFGFGQALAVWHEAKVADHAAGTVCYDCLYAKPLKQGIELPAAFAPMLLPTLPEAPPEVVVTTSPRSVPASYHSRAPPAITR